MKKLEFELDVTPNFALNLTTIFKQEVSVKEVVDAVKSFVALLK